MLTIQLIPGGFEILKDGIPWIVQTTMPDQPGVEPIPDDQRQAVAEAFLLRIQGGQPAPALSLVITDLAVDPGHAPASMIDLAKGEVTVPLGAQVTASVEIQAGGTKVPVTATFRMPVRKSDGSEPKLILVSFIQGAASVTVECDAQGIFEITEHLLNRELLPAQRLSFSGVRLFVVGN